VIQIARILCPIDFSEFSQHALHHAMAVAKWYESELTVLYIFQNLVGVDLPPIELYPAERERLITGMRAFLDQAPPGVPVQLLVREAPDVRAEILAQAAVLPADLLVIGSHGRSGFERLMLGSVTEKVMRKAPCPVMVVPPRAPDADPQRPPSLARPRILCPVDFSDGALSALEYAISLAEEADGHLTLFHSIEMPPELREHMPAAGELDVDAIRASAEAACLQRLRELVPPSVRSYCTVEAAVREGAASRQILQLAEEQKTDLIVMGVRGRGTLDLMVFGSNTERVVRAAACPVLIVRGR
jgi:nucleotide-binding universal stress UspA family protein